MPQQAPPKWPIPPINAKVPASAISLEHPTFTARKNYWAFFRDSDELTGGYEASTQSYAGPEDVPVFTETYLIPHEKEMDYNDFKRRVAAAKPPRFVREGIEAIVGVITNEEPNRDTYPDKLQDWTNQVDAEGRTLQEWIGTVLWPLVERYGLCYSYAKRPDVVAGNLAEQEKAIRAKNLPDVLLCVITPENMPWWQIDEHGNTEIVRYVEPKVTQKTEEGFPTEIVEYNRHWWVTNQGWWYTDENNPDEPELKVLGAGYFHADQSPMQYFPIVKWHLKGDIGPTEVAAFAQLMYFRKDSELHNVEVNAAFPMTWLPIGSGDENPEETVRGAHTVGGYDAEHGGQPVILETSGVALTHFIEKRLPELEEEALSPYGRQREVGGNDSGVALAHIQQSAINIYRQHALAGSQSEFRAMRPVAELLGEAVDNKTKVAWARKFGTLSDTSQGDLLMAFWNLDPGDEFKKHILSQFSQITLADLTAQQLEDAINAWSAEREEQKAKEEEERQAFLNPDEGTDGADPRREIGKPFAANPASAKGPEKGQKP